jgi:hypothetical protein
MIFLEREKLKKTVRIDREVALSRATFEQS